MCQSTEIKDFWKLPLDQINKALDPNGLYDAILLAQAGVARLGRGEAISEVISLDVLLPAPGRDLAGEPGGDGPGVRAHDGIVLEPLSHRPS